MRNVIAALLLMVLAGAQAMAQEPLKSVCDEDPRFRDFDFWVGEWIVTDRGSGEVAGSNSITSTEGGCLIREHWTSVNGGTGFSINYYNPNRGKWRQVWVANGYSIDYEGGLQDGAMRLEGKLFNYREKTEVPFRGTWTPLPDGSVRQFFETYSEQETGWQTWFDGLYVRKK